MIEEEWLNGGDYWNQLIFVRKKKASKRKLRLFGVACCRRVWHLLDDERCRRAVEIGELFADGKATTDERKQAFEQAKKATDEHPYPSYYTSDERSAVYRAAYLVASAYVRYASEDSASWITNQSSWFDRENVATANYAQGQFVRDIFGNPFRPITIDPSLLTPNVIALAETIYNERRFEDMPILADALEDAGCNIDEILSHCRSGGPHVRGCWVVDQILGKE